MSVFWLHRPWSWIQIGSSRLPESHASVLRLLCPLQEVIVNPRSLRRWFLANPPPEMNVQTSPFSESDGSTELTRNVITSKGKPGITIRVDNLSHSDLPRTTLFEEYEPRIRHTVCGHLTRYLRQGKLASKVNIVPRQILIFRQCTKKSVKQYSKSN